MEKKEMAMKGRNRMIRFVRRLQIITIFCVLMAFTLVSMPIMFSESMRRTYLLLIDRQIAKVVPPRFVFAGDSLTAHGNWGWRLARNPLSAANLAEDGASINEVAIQVSRARAYYADFLLVMAGTNDILYHHGLDQIACHYRFLLEKAPPGQRLIVTLIPYMSFPEYTADIRAANFEIRRLSERKGAYIIDINAYLSTNGLLGNELTTDGVHFNERAYEIWSNEILKLLKL
jgi:lysophospholipase L1-like esterase